MAQVTRVCWYCGPQSPGRVPKLCGGQGDSCNSGNTTWPRVLSSRSEGHGIPERLSEPRLPGPPSRPWFLGRPGRAPHQQVGTHPTVVLGSPTQAG